MITLKIQQMTVDGTPSRCPECLSEAFTLDGDGFIDAFPVWANCWNGHSWEEPLITLGDLKQINQVRTGRQRAEDVDTFEITIGGAVIAGVLHPEVTVDDIKKAVTRVYWGRLLKPALRRRKRAAVRAVTRPVKRGTSNAVAAAKAAALGAAWDWQTAGGDPDPNHQPEPVNPCPACNGQGRHKVDTRIHNITHVGCTVCSGTGEID